MGLPTKTPKKRTCCCGLFKVKEGVWTWIMSPASYEAEQLRAEWEKNPADYGHWEQAPTLGELVQQPKLKKLIDEGARTKVL
jgi:hypothetical protein